MKLHIINRSSDSVSYLSGNLIIAGMSTVEVPLVRLKDIAYDVDFIKDLTLNNIFLGDGSIVFDNYKESVAYLDRIVRPIIRLVGADNGYVANVDVLGRVFTRSTTPEVIYRTDNLRLAGSPTGSKLMKVATTSSFKFQPDLNSLSVPYYLEQITLCMEDQGDFTGTNFGALAGLTNGVQINVRSQGQVFQITNIQDNSDLYNTFSEFPGSQSVAVLLQSNRNMYFGTSVFQNRIVLNPAQGDYIEAVVRDNLTGLDHLSMRVTSYRTLG